MSLSSRTLFALVIAIFSILANAAVVEYNWDITWTKGNPDGKFERTVIGVNNQWPPPILYATKGDQIKVHVTNKLGNMTTALHFHGIFQNGTTHMDGATGATQCAIPIDSTFTYDFKVCSNSYFKSSKTNDIRSTNQVLTGGIHTSRDSIQKEFVLH